MAQPNKLELIQSERKQQPYLDFVIDVKPLVQLPAAKGENNMDCIQPFGWPGEAGRQIEAAAAARLLLKAEPNLRTGRYSLPVCPECADLGCGAVTAVVEREDDLFVWRKFGFETDYNPDELDLAAFEHIYQLAFDKREYSALLRPYPAV